MEGLSAPQPAEGKPIGPYLCDTRCFSIAVLSRSLSRGGGGLRPELQAQTHHGRGTNSNNGLDTEGFEEVYIGKLQNPQRETHIALYLAAKATEYVPKEPGDCPWQGMCSRIPGSKIPFTNEPKR